MNILIEEAVKKLQAAQVVHDDSQTALAVAESNVKVAREDAEKSQSDLWNAQRHLLEVSQRA